MDFLQVPVSDNACDMYISHGGLTTNVKLHFLNAVALKVASALPFTHQKKNTCCFHTNVLSQDLTTLYNWTPVLLVPLLEVANANSLISSFNITLEFRTLYKKGLLLYVTNEEQSEFVAVQLKDGRVVTSYDDRGQTREIESQGSLDDGQWHRVSPFDYCVKSNSSNVTIWPPLPLKI